MFVLWKGLPGLVFMLPTTRIFVSGAIKGASALLPLTGRRLQPPARPMPLEGMSGFRIDEVDDEEEEEGSL